LFDARPSICEYQRAMQNQTINGRTLYRYVLRAAHNRNSVRTCDRFMVTQGEAEADALKIAAEYGGKRPMKVALVYPVPAMPHALNESAGAP
jgi:hypothetical protein